MRFSIGGAFAACKGCGREDFFPALASISKGRRDVFICAHCGNEAVYSELVGRPGLKAPRPMADERRPGALDDTAP
jgi:hypothetical protein